MDPAAERIAHLYPRAVRNANSDSNANSDTYRNAYSYGNSDCYANRDTHGYDNVDTYTKDNSVAEESTDPAAAPVAFVDEKETHCATPTSRREHAKNFGVRFLESARFDRPFSLRSRGVFNAKRSAAGFLPPRSGDEGFSEDSDVCGLRRVSAHDRGSLIS